MKWCSFRNCNWCVSLDIAYILALRTKVYLPVSYLAPFQLDSPGSSCSLCVCFNDRRSSTYLPAANQLPSFSCLLSHALPQDIHPYPSLLSKCFPLPPFQSGSLLSKCRWRHHSHQSVALLIRLRLS